MAAPESIVLQDTLKNSLLVRGATVISPAKATFSSRPDVLVAAASARQLLAMLMSALSSSSYPKILFWQDEIVELARRYGSAPRRGVYGSFFLQP